MKNSLFFLMKVIIAIFLLWYLYQEGNLTLDSFNVFYNYPATSLIISIIFIMNLLLGTLRWKYLLYALDVEIKYKTLLDINVIGTFGSVFLLGSVGGDAMRAYYITNKMQNMKTKVILSLIVDRLLGLFGLLILTVAAAVIYYARLENGVNSGDFIKIIFVLLFLGILIGIGTLLLVSRFNLHAKLVVYKQNSRIIRLLIQILDVILIFKKNYITIIVCLLASITIQLGTLWSLALLGQEMIINGLSSLEYMTAGSFSLLANSIPLTPGGIGIGEGAFNYFCQLLSSNKGVAGYSSIFFSYRIISSSLSLVGIWRFIVAKHK